MDTPLILFLKKCTHRETVPFLAGIDLENIVYYRDNTHYFVMTAKKQSLLDKGVVINVMFIFFYLCSTNKFDKNVFLTANTASLYFYSL